VSLTDEVDARGAVKVRIEPDGLYNNSIIQEQGMFGTFGTAAPPYGSNKSTLYFQDLNWDTKGISRSLQRKSG